MDTINIKENRPAHRAKSWLSGFLSNLLGVVVGIALTFGVSWLVQRHDEKKQTREIMILLRNELILHKEQFEETKKGYERSIQSYAIFLSPEWKTLPKDTLDKYISSALSIQKNLPSHAAWDVFQNSDIIKYFSQKELVMSLSRYYAGMEWANNLWDTYCNEKLKIVLDMVDTLDADAELSVFVDRLLKNKQFRRKMTNEAYPFDQIFQQGIDLIDYSLHLMDQMGDYRYEIKDGFEAFVERKHKEGDSIRH